MYGVFDSETEHADILIPAHTTCVSLKIYNNQAMYFYMCMYGCVIHTSVWILIDFQFCLAVDHSDSVFAVIQPNLQ